MMGGGTTSNNNEQRNDNAKDSTHSGKEDEEVEKTENDNVRNMFKRKGTP